MAIATMSHMTCRSFFARSIGVSRCLSLRLAKCTTEAIRSERNVASTLARMLTHSQLCIRGYAEDRTCVIVYSRVQNLFDRDLGENLQVHQRQEVRLVVLVLADLGMIIN